MLVKICGLRRIEDINYANELKPDFVGFVFALNKVRTVTPSLAKELYDKLDHKIKAVGVFRNNSLELIKEVINLGCIDMIQLHGDEDEEYIGRLNEFTNLPIIKAYKDSKYADYLLFDSLDPGKGEVFDWKEIKRNKPFFLAGGITLDNLDVAVKEKPYCIDVSSSVESDSFKDYNKMKEFIKRCRDYE